MTFYSFRRQSGTTIERALGLETAQKAMNHDVGTRTFRRYYDRGLDHVNATDLITGTGNGQMAGDSGNIPLSLRRVDGYDGEDAVKAALNKLYETPEWLALVGDRHLTSTQELALLPTGTGSDEARESLDRDLAYINRHLHNMKEATTKTAQAARWKGTSAELTVAASAAPRSQHNSHA